MSMNDLETEGHTQLDLALRRLQDDSSCLIDPSSPVARFSSAF
jgi:hypothetical protein